MHGFVGCSMPHQLPVLGFGLGLRPDHYDAILSATPVVEWFEILTENYLVPGGKPLHYLDQIRAQYPMVMHGVSLSLGGTDPLDLSYLQSLKQLIARVQPAWISDHLCFGRVAGTHLHDLLPMPYTEEALKHVVSRIQQVQEFLGQRILIENVSSYVSYADSIMPEWEFLSEVARQADCLILLDVNNIYVSAYNHQFDPRLYLNAIDPKRVPQFHVAGHTNLDRYIIDTHDAPVIPAVWDLYAEAVALMPTAATMIERDAQIPDWPELVAELDIARGIHARVLAAQEEEMAV